MSIVDTNGKFCCFFSMQGREEGKLNRPRGIAIDKLGITVYVSVTGNIIDYFFYEIIHFTFDSVFPFESKC